MWAGGCRVIAGRRRLARQVASCAAAAAATWAVSRCSRVGTDRERAHARAAGHAEAERTALRHLEETERVTSQLLAVVSHEFRTPLTSILGYAQTLEARHDQMDPGTRDLCLQAICQEARRLERLVDELLHAATAVEVAAGDAGVRAAVDAALAALPAADRDRVDVDVEPGLVVALPAPAVEQALGHLVANGLKFAWPGTRLRVTAQREGDEVRMEVADRGPLVPEAELRRIFAPFVQLDSSDSRQTAGMGLGLHIVRRVVEAHGGRAEARNDGPWVRVAVTVPVSPAGTVIRLHDPHARLA